MLTVDLLRCRRRGGELQLLSTPVDHAREIAQAYIDALASVSGEPRTVVDDALAEATARLEGRQWKLAAGLRKLLLDGCDFEQHSDHDPLEVRQHLWRRSTELRRTNAFERGKVLADVAGELGSTVAKIEDAMFADLKSAHRLRTVPAVDAASLCSHYDLAQQQAVLLRAKAVRLSVIGSDRAAYRNLFRALKFRRLLCSVDALASGGYSIDIDGPFSLFRSGTKYGLQLALLLPHIRACKEWHLEADLLWGKERTPLTFTLESDGVLTPGDELGERSEVSRLLTSFNKLKSPWTAEASADIVHLPGSGVLVPDLSFVHDDGRRVHLEVLGFWSRAAVWRRVEWAEAGLPTPCIFAYSDRLRVSEAALPASPSGALLSFKGVVSAAAVLARLDELSSGRSG